MGVGKGKKVRPWWLNIDDLPLNRVRKNVGVLAERAQNFPKTKKVFVCLPSGSGHMAKERAGQILC